MIFLFRRLATATPGWYPPMFWFSVTSLGMFLAFWIGPLGNNLWLDLLGWLTLWLCGLLATSHIGHQSLRNIVRYGRPAIFRCRFWFELGRLHVAAIFLLLVPMMSFVVLPPNAWGVIPNGIYLLIKNGMPILACSFAACAIAGYIVSFVWNQPLRGRGFECVHFFFLIGGGVVLATQAAIALPARPAPADFVEVTILGTLAAVLLLTWIISAVARPKLVGYKASDVPAGPNE